MKVLPASKGALPMATCLHDCCALMLHMPWLASNIHTVQANLYKGRERVHAQIKNCMQSQTSSCHSCPMHMHARLLQIMQEVAS